MTSATEPRLVLATDPALPLVHFSVALRTGAALDPQGLEGLSRITARLMRRSAGGRDADELDVLIDQMGATLGSEVGASTMGFGGTVIKRSFPQLLQLLCDTLARPGLPEEELQRLKRETLAELVQLRDNDKALVRRWFNRMLFAGHAYGRPSVGYPASLDKIDQGAVQTCYRRSFVSGNLVCTFAGDLTAPDAERAVHQIAASLPQAPALVDDTPDPTPPSGRRLYIVDKPERTQTQILIGALGTHPSDEDHFPLQLANTAFGGTFTARLMQEVRAKRGWSYGANSSLPTERRRHSFSMWTFPKAEDCAPCIALQLELLQRWHDEGITAQELAAVKSYLTRSHAFDVDTCGKRASLATDEILYQLPAGYYSRYVEKVNDVNLEQANAAVRRRIDPKNLLVVVVGTEASIGKAVRAAIPDLAHSEIIPFDRD